MKPYVKFIYKRHRRKTALDRTGGLHIKDLISITDSDVTGGDNIYLLITDEISDMGFIMKTALTLMDKGSDIFYFYGKYKDIWHQTVEGIFKQSGRDCKNLTGFDNMEDAAGQAAGFLNRGRNVYLFHDRQSLGAIAADKIREHEMHVSFHMGSLLNSME